MKIVQINGEIFNQMAFAEPHTSIYQSTYYANYMSEQGYRPLFLQAVNDDDVCIGLGMFLIKRKGVLSRKNYAYCPTGYLINYYDIDELKQFNTEICKYLKENENVDSLIIEPTVTDGNEKESNYLRYTLENMGYVKEKELEHYYIDVNKFEKFETNKNLFYDIYKTQNNKKLLTKYTDFNEYLLQYDAFEKYGTLYEIVLDSFRSKSSLKKSIDENTAFINEHKEDYKYEHEINQRLQENNLMNNLLQEIARYEKTYGDNPGLGLLFLVDYSDQHLHVFSMNKDHKDGIFQISEFMINYLIEDMKNHNKTRLSSYKPIIGSEKIPFINQYIINF